MIPEGPSNLTSQGSVTHGLRLFLPPGRYHLKLPYFHSLLTLSPT